MRTQHETEVLAVKNGMEVQLARERQELAKSNIKNAKLEQRLIEMESVKGTEESGLKYVPGENGQCRRCESFVISAGV